MASLYDKAAQQWNNLFSTAPAARELAAIGASTQNAINDTVRKIDRDIKIQQGVAEALNFQKSPPHVRPKARPASLTKEISSFSAPPVRRQLGIACSKRSYLYRKQQQMGCRHNRH